MEWAKARQTEETGGCFNRGLTGVFLLFFPGLEKLVPKRMKDDNRKRENASTLRRGKITGMTGQQSVFMFFAEIIM